MNRFDYSLEVTRPAHWFGWLTFGVIFTLDPHGFEIGLRAFGFGFRFEMSCTKAQAKRQKNAIVEALLDHYGPEPFVSEIEDVLDAGLEGNIPMGLAIEISKNIELEEVESHRGQEREVGHTAYAFEGPMDGLVEEAEEA